MNESKLIPGPWQAEQDDVPYDGGFETWVVNADGVSVCMMDCPKDDMEVNAKLIAAAPDLLKACEDCEQLLLSRGDPFRGDDWQTMQDVRAAITKATGKTFD